MKQYQDVVDYLHSIGYDRFTFNLVFDALFIAEHNGLIAENAATQEKGDFVIKETERKRQEARGRLGYK